MLDHDFQRDQPDARASGRGRGRSAVAPAWAGRLHCRAAIGRLAPLPLGNGVHHHLTMSSDREQAGLLVGRRAELARLEQALTEVGGGESRAVELVGDPGIGKTRLLGEVTSRAGRRGLRVFGSWARERESGVPFAVFADAIGRQAATLEPEHLAWLERYGDGLAELLSPTWSVWSGGRDGPVPGESKRYLLYPRLREFLERCAGPAGLLLVLDDMHWADAASAELLAYLLHRPPDGPVLIAVAYRPRQLWPRLAMALRDAARLGNVSRIELGPLTREETGELLGAAVGRAERDALHRISEGNPFYLEALRDMRFRPSATGGTTGEVHATEIPYPVRAALLAELALLPDDVQLMARAAAVAGDVFDPALAVSIAELPERTAFSALDELQARDVLHVGPDARLRFRHPLLRQAVYETASGGWINAAHARAAGFLERCGASAIVRAYHVERAAGIGDRAAITLLADAASQAHPHAPATAAHWYEAALNLLEESAPAEYRTHLLISLGYTLGICGQFSRSREEFGKALSLLPHGVGARTKCVAFSAAIERLLGHHHEAAALLQAELAELPDWAGPEATMLLLELATHNFLHLEHGAQREHAERARAYALSQGNQVFQASAAMLLALAHCGMGALAPMTEFLTEAERLVDGLTDIEIAGSLQTFIGLSLAETWLDHYTDAINHLKRAVAIAHATGQEYTLSPLLTVLAEAYLCTGQLARAADCARDALDAALLTGNDQDRMLALAKRSEVALWSGDFGLAIQAAANAAELASSFTDWLAAAARGTLAVVRVLAGDHEAHSRSFPESYGGIGLVMLNPVLQARVYGLLAEAELRRGQPTRAAAWAARATSAAAELAVPGSDGHALLAESLVLLRSRPAAALDRAQVARERFTGIGAQLNAARAALATADAFAALGRHDDAAEELRQAEAGFRASGATHLYEQTRARRQRASASTATVPDGQHPGAGNEPLAKLSPRELQVALLVAEGHSNRQIARALTVTDKTVEAHVSHILGKLAVPSRAAIASIVTRAARDDHRRDHAAGPQR